MSANDQTASTEAATKSDDGDITINIKAPGDAKLSVTISKTSSVAELKKAVADKTDPRVEPENQRLIYSGRVLKDEQTLSEYKIQTGHSVHMVKGAARSANAPSSSASQVPTNLNAGQQIAGNPLAPLLNATNQIPAFNPFADLGLNHNDPNMAMDMMNNPQVLSNMQRMLEDPQVVEQIANDPRLQSIPGVREMIRSPHFRQMVFNPDMMRQMQQLMQNGGLRGMGSTFPPPGAFGTAASTTPRSPGATPQNTTTAQNSTATGAAQPGQTGQAGQTPPFNPFAMFGGVPPTATPGGTADPMAAMFNSPFGQMMMQNMMAGGGGVTAPAPTDTRPPEERFEVQLGQLQGMGFTNARQNIQALQASGGNVEAAIEYILSSN